MADFMGTATNETWTGTDRGDTARDGGGADTLDTLGGNDRVTVTGGT
jgi:hypothetical protein